MSRKKKNTPSQAKVPATHAKVAQQIAPQQHQQHGAIHQMAMKSESWFGPLPPPAQLAKFDEVVPGCAERIVRMAEQEGAHAREVQMRAVRATVRLQHIGQIMAFLLSSAALAAAYALAMAGHDWVAGSLVASGLVGLAAVFLNIIKSAKE